MSWSKPCGAHAIAGDRLATLQVVTAREPSRTSTRSRLRRYSHEPLADRIWDVRHNLSTYDAAFVALSEALQAPCVTCDQGLANAPGHTAAVELFPAEG